MNRKILIALVALIIVSIAGYCVWSGVIKQSSIDAPASVDSSIASKPQTTDSGSIQSVQQTLEKRMVASSNWETYTNTKLGFTFQYPSAWVKDAQETQAIDRSGNIIEVDINFIDTSTQTSLVVAFHTAPAGNQLYDYAVSRLANNHADDINQITVAGARAIQVTSTLKTDGKGHSIKSLRVIVVDFLAPKQKGGIEIQFNTSLPAEAETAKFNQLLSTFKFI